MAQPVAWINEETWAETGAPPPFRKPPMILKEGPNRRQPSTTIAVRKGALLWVKMSRYLAIIPGEEHFGSVRNSHKHQRRQLWDQSRHNSQPYGMNECLCQTNLPK